MADPTPPAAPRPCECGCAERSNDARLGVVCFDCGRPVSPEAAPREHPTAPHLCGSCFYDKRDCVCVTGPNAERTRRELHDVPAPPRCELLVGATSETCDLATGHPGDCSYGEPGWRSDNEHDAEAAPPRATTAGLYCTGCGKGPNPDVAVRGLAHHCGGTWEPAPLAAHPATTPEPMTEERLAVIRSRFSGYRVEWAPEVIELLNEVDRLRASSPSRESGALLDAAQQEIARFWKIIDRIAEIIGAEESDLDIETAVQMYVDWATGNLAASDARLSTLERDAARMRGIADALIESLGMADSLIEALTDRGTHHNTGDERMSETTWRRTYGTVRATKMVGCPVCGAAPAVACESVDGTMHLARFDAYNELRAPTTETPDNG